jgi:hypothetical protein
VQTSMMNLPTYFLNHIRSIRVCVELVSAWAWSLHHGRPRRAPSPYADPMGRAKSRFRVWRATIKSSLVGTTRTVQRLSGALMMLA